MGTWSGSLAWSYGCSCCIPSSFGGTGCCCDGYCGAWIWIGTGGGVCPLVVLLDLWGFGWPFWLQEVVNFVVVVVGISSNGTVSPSLRNSDLKLYGQWCLGKCTMGEPTVCCIKSMICNVESSSSVLCSMESSSSILCIWNHHHQWFIVWSCGHWGSLVWDYCHQGSTFWKHHSQWIWFAQV